MTFTSFEFLIIFPLIVIAYNIVPKKVRLLYLLSVSYLIYGFLQPSYLLLLITTSIVTYTFGRWIGRTDDDDKKHSIMRLGIIVILAPLFFFKYFNSVDEGIMSVLQSIGITVTLPTIRWMLPLGVSYYTFMSIGYLVDLYNEDVQVETNPLSVALFLSFFPIVFSGPIERAGNMFPQISLMQRSKLKDISDGAKMMLWGYFMKLCVADRLGLYVTNVYADVAIHNGATLGLTALLFPLQEYADLGGYSLIAIGAARCLGFNIIPNFKRPFFATSMSVFWRRWHMSLIQWLTDYIYTPMSYALRSWKSLGVVCALMVTFLVSGIWHGASMTCIVWGLMQGGILSIESLTLKKRVLLESKYHLKSRWWYNLICIIIVYIIFAFSEIYGMSNSISDANMIVKRIFSETGSIYIEKTNLIIGFFFVAIMMLKEIVVELKYNVKLLESNVFAIRYVTYLFLVLSIVLLGILDNNQFIYFQF